MNDYLDYLAHYRTPGSKNGISHTPGYDAVGKPAMTAAERKAARKAYKKEIKNAKNYDYRNSEKYKNASKTTKNVMDNDHWFRSRQWGKRTANRMEYIKEKYGAEAERKYRKQTLAKMVVGTAALMIGMRTVKKYVSAASLDPSGAKRNVSRGKEVVRNVIKNVTDAASNARSRVFKTVVTDANGKVIKRSFKQMYTQGASLGTGLIRR